MTEGSRATATDVSEVRDRKRPALVAVQAIGFLVGVGLLGWAVSQAFAPANREQLSKLTEASAAQLVGLFALTAATITLNGLIFWVILLPERRLRVLDVVATNALATFLSYLPFKMGMISRIVVHTRRDGLPLFLVGAWVIAFAVLLAASFGPVLGVSLWRGGVDVWWWVASAGALVGGVGLLAAASWVFAGERGMSRLHRVVDPLGVGPLKRFARGERFGQLHAGFGMLAHPGSMAAAVVLRVMDVGALSARFVIAAAVLGVDLTWQDAILMGVTFFVAGALSPFGEVGTREAATIALAQAVGVAAAGEGGPDAGLDAAEVASNPVAIITLFVSGTESIVRVVSGGFAVVWLRIDRLVRPGGGAERTVDSHDRASAGDDANDDA